MPAKDLLELIRTGEFRDEGVWKDEVLTSHRLHILQNHFEQLGIAINRDFHLFGADSDLLSSANLYVAALNGIFTDLSDRQEKQKARLLWDRLNDEVDPEPSLKFIHGRLYGVCKEYQRLALQAKPSRKGGWATDLGTEWPERFAGFEEADAKFRQALHAQTSDIIIPIRKNQNVDTLQQSDVDQLIASVKKKQGRPVTYILTPAAPLFKGGYGAVYKGTREGKAVAVKQLFAFTSELHKLLPRLAREFLSMVKLNHPNVLPLISVSIALDPDDHSYLVTPWATGGNARSFVRGKGFEPRLRIISQTLMGLAYLHQNDIIHGDLKGANIMMTSDGTAMVGDFGLSTVSTLNVPESYRIPVYSRMQDLLAARGEVFAAEVIPAPTCGDDETEDEDNDEDDADEIDEDDDEEEEEEGDQTMLGIGTPGWSAPEVQSAYPVMGSDIFAYGRTIYELMTELNPPSRGSLSAPKNCSTGDPFFEALWDLIQRCTADSIATRAYIREIHLRLDEVWLEYSRAQSYTPSSIDVIKTDAYLRKAFHQCNSSVPVDIDHIILSIIDEARYWSRVVVRSIVRDVNDPALVSPALTRGELSRLRNIRVRASDSEPSAVDERWMDFPNPMHHFQIKDNPKIHRSRAGKPPYLTGEFLTEYMTVIDDIEYLRGFPRKIRTYDVDPDILELWTGDTIEISGTSFLYPDAMSFQMELFYGLPISRSRKYHYSREDSCFEIGKIVSGRWFPSSACLKFQVRWLNLSTAWDRWVRMSDIVYAERLQITFEEPDTPPDTRWDADQPENFRQTGTVQELLAEFNSWMSRLPISDLTRIRIFWLSLKGIFGQKSINSMMPPETKSTSLAGYQQIAVEIDNRKRLKSGVIPVKETRTCRIRVHLDPPASTPVYVSRSAEEYEYFELCADPSNALQVEFSQAVSPHELIAVNALPNPCRLGVSWQSPSKNVADSRSRMKFSTLDPLDEGSETKWLSSTSIWTVHPDGTLTAGWYDTKLMPYEMIPVLKGWDDGIEYSYVALTDKFGARSDISVRLAIEPV